MHSEILKSVISRLITLGCCAFVGWVTTTMGWSRTDAILVAILFAIVNTIALLAEKRLRPP